MCTITTYLRPELLGFSFIGEEKIETCKKLMLLRKYHASFINGNKIMNNLYKLYKHIFELYPTLTYKFNLYKYEHVLYTIIYFKTNDGHEIGKTQNISKLATSMNFKANYINPAKFLLWLKHYE